ncbi:glycoside hydrolase family 38 C-terminal domain-containing protein [Phycisphaerales bacterium AB-hyl4]|uniref:Glycoside hydrolase family 38 C-terminal domain-containing protein n=1 Tax=Natronomicrosphaera hydrolytica TaxID=3242702 RepID=A0ABV4U8H5_9BACT
MSQIDAPPKQQNGSTTSVHYLSGTHWDREWYRPLQEFRLLLVQLVDELLDLMESNPAFKYFHLDGQTCVLQDYIEIRPENRDRLAALIREGRILVGPWFTMPDLFCVGEEALVRNLLLGRRVAREWGVEPMPVGFTCDMFGHPSQMPQLFAGFDMRHCVVGRGTNEHTTPMFFQWESPDGSQVFSFKLQDAMGYGAFAVPRAVLEKPTAVLDELPEFTRAMEQAGDDDKKRTAVREKWFRERLAHYVNHELERSNGKTIALMDWMDHIMPASDVKRYLRLIHETRDDVQAEHSTLPTFLADAERTAHDVPVRSGELREPSRDANGGYLWLIPNCVSSRVRLKQANDACQNLLEKWVEPMLAIVKLRGTEFAPRLLRTAWEHVLLNHAHDSICGCSIDQVHRDMMYRYDQARILAEQLRAQAVGVLTQGCRELGRTPDEFTLTLVNPLPQARREVVVFDVDFPLDYPEQFTEGFRSQPIKSFTLEDASGTAVPYQRLSMIPQLGERSRHALPCFQSEGKLTRYTVAAEVDLPAMGFTNLRVVPSKRPVRRMGSLRTAPSRAENEHLIVEIAPNGTLTLIDKQTDQTYTDLLGFDDRSEIGDGWFHGHALNDEQALSHACSAQVSVVHEGPDVVSFQVALTMQLPARYDWHEQRPVDERVSLGLSHVITLRRGAKLVEVATTIDNTAEDHRLQLLLPTDAREATTYVAHHPYDVVERSIALDSETVDWREAEIAEKPFLGLQAVGAGQRGLALLSAAGLHEGGVRDDARRTMQVTLLRSFRRTVGTEGEQDGLESGRTEHRYALMPFAGQLPAVDALQALASLQAGIFTRQSGKRASGFPPLAGEADPRQSFMTHSGELVVSAIKSAEQGDELVVRLWNPGAESAEGTLTFADEVKAARRLKLHEEVDDDAPSPQIRERSVRVSVAPHKIATVGVSL